MRSEHLSLKALCCAAALLSASFCTAAEPTSESIVKTLGARKGLVVLVGATDGELATALVKAEPLLVYALAPDAAIEAKLRQAFVAAGIHGQATAGCIGPEGTLPLNDEVATIVVADLDTNKQVKREEALRIVHPLGLSHFRQNGRWQTAQKERPLDVDDWPQYFHDGAMSDLSQDKRAGPAYGLQWEAGPSTTHSLGVRIVGDVWISADEFGVVARDAFSGLPLWRRTDLKVRDRYALLADSQRVYLYPDAGERGMPAPHMLALDLRSGKALLEYADGLVFKLPPELNAKDAPKAALEAFKKRPNDHQARLADGILVQNAREELVAVDAASGKRLWSANIAAPLEWAHPVLTGGKLYAVQGAWANSASYTHWPMTLVQRVVALELKSGKELWAWDWRQEMPAVLAKQPVPQLRKHASIPPPEERVAAVYNMAFCNGRLVLAVRAELENTLTGAGVIRQLVLNADNGKLVAYGATPAGDLAIGAGHSHLRVLPIGNRLWFLEATKVFGTCDVNAPTDESKFGRDYAKLLRPVGCTVFRASTNWLFGSLTAYALDGSALYQTNVARATCDVGAFPANGMTYITPNQCFCRPYLPGSNAFHPRKPQPAEEFLRLEHGGASPAPAAAPDADAWPMYLRNALRSSWCEGNLPQDLAQVWSVRMAEPLNSLLGQEWSNQWYGQGPVTGVSVAEGICVVGLTDRQQIVAIDPTAGKEKWRIAVDGRIDSQPTIFKGLVLAGTRTGWVYALNRDTGALIWRFFAAPRRTALVADGQLESPWPVFGAVLADDEGVWAFAGRHNDCDGGLWWWRLDTISGEVLSSGRLGQDTLRPSTGFTGGTEETPDRFDCANGPALSDGKLILLARAHLERKNGTLVPFTGLVADGGNEPKFWEKRFACGLLVPGTQGLLNRNVGLYGYKLSAFGLTQARQFAWKGNDFVSLGGTTRRQNRGGDGGSFLRRFQRFETLKSVDVKEPKTGETRQYPTGAEQLWENPLDLARGSGAKVMAVGGNMVLVGLSVENKDRNKERERMPHRLLGFDLERGQQIFEQPIPAPAILGGISIAGGKVYVVTSDGTVTCFAGKSPAATLPR